MYHWNEKAVCEWRVCCVCVCGWLSWHVVHAVTKKMVFPSWGSTEGATEHAHPSKLAVLLFVVVFVSRTWSPNSRSSQSNLHLPRQTSGSLPYVYRVCVRSGNSRVCGQYIYRYTHIPSTSTVALSRVCFTYRDLSFLQDHRNLVSAYQPRVGGYRSYKSQK